MPLLGEYANIRVTNTLNPVTHGQQALSSMDVLNKARMAGLTHLLTLSFHMFVKSAINETIAGRDT